MNMTLDDQLHAILSVTTIIKRAPASAPPARWFYYASELSKWLPCANNDPLNDLNVMRELENVLTDEQFWDWSKDKHTDMSYNGHLFRLVDNATPLDRPCRYHSANAAQRREAFLRTVGKWKE